MDERQLSAPKFDEEHVGVVVENLSYLIDQLTRRMPPPRPGHGSPSEEGHE
jgi:hypothetical protein